ncbi:MAG: 50S ribosomal protein L13 [Patescibacteria group bacterium]|jgi:large subunit ribosomal protein L13|nr:50S ribosomal protein L13 [Patescibacteria group bacterium]
MKTYWAKPTQIEKKWFLIDANGQTLGRLATVIADLLRGKNKPEYTPSMDCGDFVVVINTSLIKVTGNKLEAKKYYSHSGYPGGLKEKTLNEVINQNPNKVIRQAVLGMLPKNKLSSQIIKKLKLYQGSDHQNIAQKPEKLELS